jgi:hypothetical protein
MTNHTHRFRTHRFCATVLVMMASLGMLLALCGSLGQGGLTRLVVPGDICGGRYVSNLVSLEVLDSETSA